MIVELVTTGSELLLGEITNYNSAYLSKQLNEMGYFVVYHTTVGDNPKRMKDVLKTALSRADIVITTGGLGPTQGDMTKIIGAELMNCPLVYDPAIADAVQAWVTAHHGTVTMTENQKRQAMIPEGADVFDNEAGTAPGVAMQGGGKTLVHLPGPPSEMRWMYENRLKPWLLQTFGSQGSIRSLYIKIYDMGEAFIEERLMDLVKDQSNPTLAMYARPGFVEVRLTARADSEEQAEELLLPLEKKYAAVSMTKSSALTTKRWPMYWDGKFVRLVISSVQLNLARGALSVRSLPMCPELPITSAVRPGRTAMK